MIIDPKTLKVVVPHNQELPDEGPVSIPLILDFSGAVGTYTVDLLNLQQQGFISRVQCLYIDNADGSAPLTVTINGSNQRIVAPANTQGYYPVLCPNPAKLQFDNTAHTIIITVFLLNMPVSGVVWSTV